MMQYLYELAHMHWTEVVGYPEIEDTPHSQQQRFMVVPFDEGITRITWVYLEIRRTSAATTPGVAMWRVQFDPPVDVPRTVAKCILTSNNVGDFAIVQLPLTIYTSSGGNLKFYTSDTSVGGTCVYTASCVYQYII